jgi:hypothetical protein
MSLREEALAAFAAKEEAEQKKREEEYRQARFLAEKTLTDKIHGILGRDLKVETEWRNVDGVERCYAQVDGLLFTVRESHGWMKELVYVRRCPECGTLLHSEEIAYLHELGEWLTDWPKYHPCENNQDYNVTELGLKPNGEPLDPLPIGTRPCVKCGGPVVGCGDDGYGFECPDCAERGKANGCD